MGHTSGSDSNAAAPAGPNHAPGPVDFFDIDAFLDDYVNDLGNQDPLEINLDFSLPFPARPAADHVPGGHPMPPLPAAAALPPAPPLAAAPSRELTMPEPTSDSEAPSEPRARPQRATRGRAPTAAKSKASKEEKAEPRTAAAQRKHLALQEKNRRAQRRFRERQKQRVVELEAQVEGLAQALNAMTTERDALARRAMELEAVANNSIGNNGTSPCDGVPAAPRPAPASEETCSDAGHAPSAACAQGITLTPKLGGPEVVLSPAELCAMPQPVLSGHFAALVKECARTFVEGAGTPEMEVRVTQLADQALALWQRVAACNPPTSKLFATAKLDEAGRGQPADERAPHIVRSLGLTDAQKSELCALRRGLLARVAAAAAARAAAATPSLGAGAAAGPYNGTSGRALAGHQLAVRHASRTVAASLQEEHAALADFEATVTRRVLEPPQAAQLLIQSYPWPPDCLALATWVAAEGGEPEALAALAAEAQARAVSAAAAVAGTIAGKGGPAASPFITAAPPHAAMLAAAAANATASSVNTGVGPCAAMLHALR